MGDAQDGATTPPLRPASDSKHVPPSWAGEPQHDMSLEVIKDGVEVQRLPVADRSYYVLGRSADGSKERASLTRRLAVTSTVPVPHSAVACSM